MIDFDGPRAGVDYPETWQEFVGWFHEDDACREWLAGLRWPDGFICPACGGRQAWRMARRGMWMCGECHRQTSVTAGTVLHRSHTPLTTWFAAMWMVCATKNGISAAALGDVLGFGSEETAWAWLHKLRRVMVRPDRDQLSGIVEVDETQIRMVSGRPGSRGARLVPVMIAVETPAAGVVGRVRMAPADQVNSYELFDFTVGAVAPGSTVRSDGVVTLKRLTEHGYRHDPRVMADPARDAAEHLPAVHLVASLLKRWLAGTFHYGVARRHLAYYLDEYTFRFNRRTSKSRGLLFYRLAQQAMATDPKPLTSIIGGTMASDQHT